MANDDQYADDIFFHLMKLSVDYIEARHQWTIAEDERDAEAWLTLSEEIFNEVEDLRRFGNLNN